MSSISRWSYRNVAQVRALQTMNLETGETVYAEPYDIACTWTAESTMQREMGGQGGARGAEFVSKHTIYTEDKRPKYLDEIMFDGSDGWEQIRSVTNWDMSPLGEPDSPDFKLVT